MVFNTENRLLYCMKKAFVLIMLIAFVLSILFLQRCNKESKKIATAVIAYMDENVAENPRTIRLSDITDFEWDKMLVFRYPTTNEEIKDALGVDYDSSLDLVSGVIFVKNNKIVYDETFDIHFDAPPIFSMYPNRDINAKPKYKVFTIETAVLECERVYIGGGEDIYWMYPHDENSI